MSKLIKFLLPLVIFTGCTENNKQANHCYLFDKSNAPVVCKSYNVYGYGHIEGVDCQMGEVKHSFIKEGLLIDKVTCDPH